MELRQCIEFSFFLSVSRAFIQMFELFCHWSLNTILRFRMSRHNLAPVTILCHVLFCVLCVYYVCTMCTLFVLCKFVTTATFWRNCNFNLRFNLASTTFKFMDYVATEVRITPISHVWMQSVFVYTSTLHAFWFIMNYYRKKIGK